MICPTYHLPLGELVFFRWFLSRHPALILKPFISYICPTLEFNSNIWNPTIIPTKTVPSLSHLTYLEKLGALELKPFELRYLKLYLIRYYKVLNNLTCRPTEPDLYFHLHYPPPLFLNPVLPSKIVRLQYKSPVYIQNSLPKNVKQSSSLT